MCAIGSYNFMLIKQQVDICHVSAISVSRNPRQICKLYRSNQAVLRPKHALTDG